jgi:hypothetical protein
MTSQTPKGLGIEDMFQQIMLGLQKSVCCSLCAFIPFAQFAL